MNNSGFSGLNKQSHKDSHSIGEDETGLAVVPPQDFVVVNVTDEKALPVFQLMGTRWLSNQTEVGELLRTVVAAEYVVGDVVGQNWKGFGKTVVVGFVVLHIVVDAAN